MQKTLTLAATLAAFTALGGSAIAQTPPPPPPAHHGLFGKLFHPRPKPGQPATGSFGRPSGMMHGRSGMMRHSGMMGHSGMGGMTGMHGGVIGNKNTHVFHMPGDKGALPAPQNRVYFPTAAAAMAAGYHRSGSTRGMMGHHPMMQGSPRMGMPMHGRLPGTTPR